MKNAIQTTDLTSAILLTNNAPLPLTYPNPSRSRAPRVRSSGMVMGFLVCGALTFSTFGCTTTEPHDPRPGDQYVVQWSEGVRGGGKSNIGCGGVIDRPCPFILFTTRMSLTTDPGMVWENGVGGVDVYGVQAEHHIPWIDTFAVDANGALVITQVRDDAGERLPCVLAQNETGYDGDVTWQLEGVAGAVTFHVELTFDRAAN